MEYTEKNKEFNEIIKKRDKQRFLRELADLEKQEVSCWNTIFWNVVSLLIIEPIGTTVAVWYFLDQINSAFAQGVVIQNLGSNVKFTALAIAGAFTLTSLNLIYQLWKVSSLKKQIVKTKEEISHLE